MKGKGAGVIKTIPTESGVFSITIRKNKAPTIEFLRPLDEYGVDHAKQLLRQLTEAIEIAQEHNDPEKRGLPFFGYDAGCDFCDHCDKATDKKHCLRGEMCNYRNCGEVILRMI